MKERRKGRSGIWFSSLSHCLTVTLAVIQADTLLCVASAALVGRYILTGCLSCQTVHAYRLSVSLVQKGSSDNLRGDCVLHAQRGWWVHWSALAAMSVNSEKAYKSCIHMHDINVAILSDSMINRKKTFV